MSDAFTLPYDGAITRFFETEAPEDVREASRRRVLGLIETVRQALPADSDPRQAAVIASSLVGTVQLARVLGDQAGALLQAARAAILDQYDSTLS